MGLYVDFFQLRSVTIRPRQRSSRAPLLVAVVGIDLDRPLVDECVVHGGRCLCQAWCSQNSMTFFEGERLDASAETVRALSETPFDVAKLVYEPR